MKPHVRPRLALVLSFAISTSLFTATLPAAEVAAPTAATDSVSVSPEVLHALDSVYLAAKQADTTQAISGSADRGHSVNRSSHAARRRGSTMGHMVAMGVGVAAGVMALNLVSGGIGTVSRMYTMTSIMLGGMLGDYAYKQYTRSLPSVPASVSQRVSP
jgi:hypothetical protein